MIMSDSNERVDNDTVCFGDEICVIRFVCNNKNIFILNDLIEAFDLEKIEGCKEQFILQYYKYTGKSRTVSNIYNANIKSTKLFEANNHYFQLSNIDNFRKTALDKKWFFFEASYLNNYGTEGSFINICDTINFQYISLLQNKLNSLNAQYRIFVFERKTKLTSLIYSPLSMKDYMQIRCYCFLLNDDNNNRLYFLTEDQWQRCYSEKIGERHIRKDYENSFGRILPLMPITAEFVKKCQEKEYLESHNVFDELVNNYKKKATMKWPQFANVLNEKVNTDSLLESLLFLSVLSYLSLAGEDDVDRSKRTLIDDVGLEILHERCIDFAQGIYQLLENSLFHAILNPNGVQQGTGILSIRIRGKKDFMPMVNQKSINEKIFEGIDYFAEICITDNLYSSSDFLGIVEKFRKNIELRVDNASEEYRTCLMGLKDCEIPLRRLFGIDEPIECNESDAFYRYITNKETVAYHYGLQILDNTVKTAGGFLCVRSGKDDNNLFVDTNDDVYNHQNLNWNNGTAYVLFFPIRYDKYIDRTDSVAISNDDSNKLEKKNNEELKPAIGKIIKKFIKLEYKQSVNVKNNVVEKILSEYNDIKINKEAIYIFNCEDITTQLEYEILAKFIFRWLAEEQSANNIAIINVKSRADVIKVFREFLLFYNRNGENLFMKDKNVFIVDTDAKIDLFLQDNIKTIKSNVRNQQIYGGLDDIAMKIIDFLGDFNRGN